MHTKLNPSFKILETLLKASLGQYSQASPGLRCISAKTISSRFSLLIKINQTDNNIGNKQLYDQEVSNDNLME